MKTKLKKVAKGFLKLCLPSFVVCRLSNARGKRGSLFKNLQRYKVVIPCNKVSREEDYVRQMDKVFSKVSVDFGSYFLYPFDPNVVRCIPSGYSFISSITVDYGKVLKSSLVKLEEKLRDCADVNFRQTEMLAIAAIRKFNSRILEKAKSCNANRKGFFLEYLPRMLDAEPQTFEEALQKLLFYDAIFWQANHWHIGLGRLDKILYPYYKEDVEAGRMTKEKAFDLLKSFCLLLHRNMQEKSLSLIGDTGQYILLSGIDEDGNTVSNELTVMFLKLFAQLNVPDPKLILRVNDQTDSEVWQAAIECIKSGCGSPLLMNENLIMRNMVKFGYDADDVFNVGTSACWEPLVIGKSFDQNNPLPSVVAVDVLNKLLFEKTKYNNFAELLQEYKVKLSERIHQHAKDIAFDCSPFFTLFFDDCLQREKDFTEGGARYAYHGMQIVSFPNVINALLNIKKYVFDEKLFGIDDAIRAIQSNYQGYEDMQRIFRNNTCQFGSDEQDALSLTNELLAWVNSVMEKVRVNGEKVKIGISSPTYIGSSKNMCATLDGRNDGEPFAVHISPVSEQVGIKEVCDFAAQLNYSTYCLNGNVVDYILPSAFADAPDKLEIILRDSIKNGIFELQLNVLNVETLIDAKLHPEKHKDLIVRVWGFSAYFNDLPDEYKDYLIKRAKSYAA